MRRTLHVGAALVIVGTLLSGCASAGSTGEETDGIRTPKVVKRVDPEYPSELRELGVQGVVVIRGTVPKEGGLLRNPHVVRSDHPALASYALDAVSRWLFSPGLQDGEPVDVDFTTDVRFSLTR